MKIQENLERIRQKIDAACRRAGRSPAEVTLVGVAKGQSIERIAEAVTAGLTDIGENYAQEFLKHVGALLAGPSHGAHQGAPLQPRWHFVGHLQRNKVKQVIGPVGLIHSLDSLELANEIERHSAGLEKSQPVLIEVNLGGEKTKSGIDPNAVGPSVIALNDRLHLSLKGLMGIPPWGTDPEESRPFFRKLRQILDEINRQRLYKEPLTELSIGMTSDFEIAIEEGATLVRIGTGLFGVRA